MPPIIALGQQPNGFLPKKFFVAKIETARQLQKDVGGEIVLFWHDSDADHRETQVNLKGKVFNFCYEGKAQRKWTPLADKEMMPGCMADIRQKISKLVPEQVLDAWDSNPEKKAGPFCLHMYRELGLLEGIKVMRSADPGFRRRAEVSGDGYFYDTEHEGVKVRAGIHEGRLRLHKGGGSYIDLGPVPERPDKARLSPGREARFDWMNSVIRATHYVAGESEAQYLKGIRMKYPAELIPRKEVEGNHLSWIPGER